ncbi:ArsR/SmtB family transcription factor [Aliidiomarina quisquiliarum]|uniref:ArsR/SmtB family transcription factor n=1 Tax=Aliidiomarina quisquiliarum TaxID=2938947 RepID=UPI00208F6667|nr:metalloregulator ArsR/SmtB family transcription factor [Aliidiomarina quisquiliarum]
MNTMTISQMQNNVLAAEELLKSLANNHRLMVLCHLVNGEMSVGDLEKELEVSQSSLSQHLARLRSQGIVEFRKEGTTVLYRVADEKALRILETLYRLYCS